ncbi:MAG: hypothetical protein CVU38_05915 [Chloroflexi bacterium HGW-Chloroflexi-1]|nr:MAG: hypothetical protein CVU38_05915 [Chloroflexi bacterium HGW-Chloroflexi-1]
MTGTSEVPVTWAWLKELFMTRPVLVDVIAPMPEGWGLCTSCEMLIAQADLDRPPAERGLDEYPPEWQADFRRLSALIFDLANRYGDRVLIRIYDPRSLQGLIKALRYGVRRYPTFVVAGREQVAGLDGAAVERLLRNATA